MHLQPLYAGRRRYGGEVAEDLLRRGHLPAQFEQPHARRAVVCHQLVRRCAGAGGLAREDQILTT